MAIAVQNHGDDAPSGEDLEYEKPFVALLLAAKFADEQQMGDSVKEAQEPDPKAIIEHATEVLAASNDLRAGILYGYARLRLDGFPGLAEGTTYLRACLEEYWESCHPQLDADDDDDPTMRVNSMLGLIDQPTMIKTLRRAPLTKSPAFGMMSLRDLAIASGDLPTPEGMENPPTSQTISAAFQDTAEEVLVANMAAVRTALADIVAINGVFDERLPGQGPNLGEISVLLKSAEAALAPYVGGSETADDETVADQGVEAASPGVAAPAAVPGAINSPADVEKALTRIIEYYAKHEPSSPLPILLDRARRLIGADFMTIIQDLAPLGLENVQLVGGMENPE